MKAGWSLDKRDRQYIETFFPLWDWLYHQYFHVHSDGWHHIPEGKMLLVGSHNGGLAAPDLHMLIYDWYRRFGFHRAVYGLMSPRMWEEFPHLAAMTEKVGAIAANPWVASQAFAKGAGVLVYPGGGLDAFRPFDQWDKICLANRKGFIKLALKERVPIVPIVSVGAHHTLYVLADLNPLLKELNKKGLATALRAGEEVYPVYWGLPYGITFGAIPNWPLPATIHIRICPPIYLEPAGDPAKPPDRDFVDQCYETVRKKMQDALDGLIEDSPYRKEPAAPFASQLY